MYNLEKNKIKLKKMGVLKGECWPIELQDMVCNAHFRNFHEQLLFF